MDSLGSENHTLWIARVHWDLMLRDVAFRAPQEACGLVGGMDWYTREVFVVENILKSAVQFRMDPQEQLRIILLLEKRGWDLLAIYHSHPHGPPVPSPTDLREAAYPEVINLIWSRGARGWNCRGFFIAGGEAQEISLSIQ